MKLTARFISAVLGIAVATGAVFFTASLTTTNNAQAPIRAQRALAAYPVPAAIRTCGCTVDFRPGGHVMQGRPMRALLAAVDDPAVCANGKGPDLPADFNVNTPKVLVSRALFVPRVSTMPPIGSMLKFVGRFGVMKAQIAGILPQDAAIPMVPNCFVNAAAAKIFADEMWVPYAEPKMETLAAAFMSDAGRNLDRVRPLLLGAAILTALVLLINALFLSIESQRRSIAILRILGLTRMGVAMRTLREALVMTIVGVVLGLAIAAVALIVFVATDPGLFPEGVVFSGRVALFCGVATFILAPVAALCTLNRALGVRPLEVTHAKLTPKRRIGMLIAFTFGFGAFVAVEVWGSSLMSSFMPSPEWPDAIVSLLPGGLSSQDILKLKDDHGRPRIDGVKSIHELAPLQLPFSPLEPLQRVSGRESREGDRRGGSGGRGGRGAYHNVLFLASDLLPNFRFVGNTREQALSGLEKGGCVITAMMARARKLHLGDQLSIDVMGETRNLPIVGIVDLNWHMVTSRGLVRGLNRMPVFTDGPAFITFDTLDSIDPRAPERVRMTHLWINYESSFVSQNGVFGAGRKVEEAIANYLGIAVDTTVTQALVDQAAITIRLHARDEIADGTLGHGNDIIGSMARIPFIFLVVLAFGFIASLVAAADARRQEFAIYRAVGATRIQLIIRLSNEAVRTALGGILGGLLLGAAAGWLFTFVTRAAMAHWGIPPNFAVPWQIVFEGAIGAIIFTLFVAVPTASVIVLRETSRT